MAELGQNIRKSKKIVSVYPITKVQNNQLRYTSHGFSRWIYGFNW
jgi:hypothetical protein